MYQQKGELMIIAIEGIDFTGKDTQIKQLYKWLRELWVTNCYVHRFPKKGKTPITDHLNGKFKLTDEELAVEYLREMIKEKDDIILESGRGIVVINRYFYSTIAYQGPKLGVSKMIDSIKKLPLPKPEYVILFDGDPGIFSKRKKKKDKFESNIELQEHARQVYLKLSETRPFEAKWIIINAEKSKAKVTRQFKKVMENILSLKTQNSNSVV